MVDETVRLVGRIENASVEQEVTPSTESVMRSLALRAALAYVIDIVFLPASTEAKVRFPSDCSAVIEVQIALDPAFTNVTDTVPV
jgi:hypothetical protein